MGGIGTRTGHHRYTTRALLHGHPDDFAMLFDGHRRRFAGGAHHAYAVGALGNMPVNELSQAVVVDGTIVAHGGDQGHDAAGDRFHVWGLG